jgi:hypothetical protein
MLVVRFAGLRGPAARQTHASNRVQMPLALSLSKGVSREKAQSNNQARRGSTSSPLTVM